MPRIDSFALDSREPPSSAQPSIPDPAELALNKEVDLVARETRLWRVACSAHWVAWGVVQAHVPGMPSENAPEDEQLTPNQGSDPLDVEGSAFVEDLADKRPDTEEEGKAAEDEEFDYLSYAKDRAMLFWGDVVQLGLVEPGELPEEVMRAVKTIQY